MLGARMAGGGGVMVLVAEVIGDNTKVTIGLVGSLLVGVWLLSGKLQKLSDGQQSSSKRLSRIERKLGISEGDVEDVED